MKRLAVVQEEYTGMGQRSWLMALVVQWLWGALQSTALQSPICLKGRQRGFGDTLETWFEHRATGALLLTISMGSSNSLSKEEQGAEIKPKQECYNDQKLLF